MRSVCAWPAPDDHIVLPEIISKEPLGPSVRHGDDQWFDIVKWTHYAMLNAEELGITSEEHRRDDEVDQSGHQAPASAPKAITASSSV